MRISKISAYFLLLFVKNIVVVKNEFKNIHDSSKKTIETVLSNIMEEDVGDTVKEIIEGFEVFNETGVLPTNLYELSRYMTPSADIRRLEIGRLQTFDQKILCIACRAAAEIAIKFVRLSPFPGGSGFKKLATKICIYFKLQTKEVCEGLIDLNWPAVHYILKHRETELNAESLCAVLLQGSNCGTSNPTFDWSLNIDQNYPKVQSPKEIPKNLTHMKNLKILHLTDIHYDQKYLIGSKTDCNEPLCCRKPISTGIFEINTNSSGAGKWSDYNNCDVPWNLYTETLDHIQKQHKDFDFIYFTGDVIDHAVWETSKSSNIKSMQKVYKHMKKVFGNITVFPIIGNHEPSPLNLFAPDCVTDQNLSTQWLYEFVADQWKFWLDKSDIQKTIRRGGYYTITPRKGFRIIALNNNEAYTFNFWLLYKPRHLTKQLQWLHDILLQAEKSHEFVHILMHMPSGESSCFNTWSREFRRILERFHHIIGGIFYGHTHFDEFNLYYSMNNSNYPLNIGWNGGSLTPFHNLNPNYRIYEINNESFHVVEHETWIFNLTAANLKPLRSPNWFKEYSLKKAYGLNDLSSKSLDQLVKRFTNNKTLLEKYWRYKVKYADTSLQSGCDTECLEKHYCELVTTQSDDLSKCISLPYKDKDTLDNIEHIT